MTTKFVKQRSLPLIKGNEIVIRFGNDLKANSCDRTQATIFFEQKLVPQHLFYIVPECPYEVILGKDYCHKAKLKLEFTETELFVNATKLEPIRRNKFQITDQITIPAYTIMCVEVVPTEKDTKGTHLIKPTFDESKYELLVAEGLIEFDDNNKAYLCVANNSNSSITLPKKFTVGEEEEYEPTTYNSPEDLNEEDFTLDINSSLNIDQEEQLKQLLQHHKPVFGKPTKDRSKIGIKHQIITEPGHPPIKQRPYRTPISLETDVELEIQKMLNDNIIRPSKSPYASPITLVKKKDGRWRFCVDYRKLNFITKKEVYPLPRINDLLTKLKGAEYYTTLDLRTGYWQIPMHEDSIEKTAFVTTKSLYEFLVLPFGLCTAPNSFMKLINSIFDNNTESFVLAYLDDIIIISKSFQDHLRDIDTVLQRLRDNHLVCKLSKCSFAYNSIRFLGHMISNQGISPDPAKIEVVKKWKRPRNKTDNRSFLGFTGFYRRFIEGYSTIAQPLYQLTHEDTPFEWSEEAQRAFETLREKLISAPIVKQFDPQYPVKLSTDASGTGLGAVLEQTINGKDHVIEYASRTVYGREKNYHITELECLALVWAIMHFRHYLFGMFFTVYTDHHALCWLNTIKNPSGRLARWAITLSEFNFKVVYKKGKENANADCLSRYCTTTFPPEKEILAIQSFNLEEIAKTQREDHWCSEILNSLDSYPNFEVVEEVLYKKSYAYPTMKRLLCIPEKWRLLIISRCHDALEAGHLGRERTLWQVKSRFYWPTLYREVKNYVLTCDICQKNRPRSIAPQGQLHSIPPGDIFDHVGIDIVGPLHKTNRNNSYIIVLTDYGSRYAEAQPLSDITSLTIINFLLERLFLRYGCPSEISSDRGVQFVSKITEELFKIMCCKHKITAAYHPEANGLTERFNKTLISIIRKFVDTNQSNWDLLVPFAVWAYNTTPQRVTQESPYKLVFGRDPVLLLDQMFEGMRLNNKSYFNSMKEMIESVRDAARERIVEQQARDKTRFDARHKIVEFEEGDQVLIKRNASKPGFTTKLLVKYYGPFKVKKKISEVNYLIEKAKKDDVVHISNLARYYPRALSKSLNEVDGDLVESPNRSAPHYERRTREQPRLEGWLIVRRDTGAEEVRRSLRRLDASVSGQIDQNSCTPRGPHENGSSYNDSAWNLDEEDEWYVPEEEGGTHTTEHGQTAETSSQSSESTQPLNSEHTAVTQNSVIQNSTTQNSVIQNSITQNSVTLNSDTQNSDTQNNFTQNVNTQNSDTQNFETQNTFTQNVNTQNMDTQNNEQNFVNYFSDTNATIPRQLATSSRGRGYSKPIQYQKVSK